MIVEDTGPNDAKILICGEAPGRDEERAGEPFVGPAGKLLKQMLSHSGIDFGACYVTNVSPERPPNNKFTHFYEDNRRKVPTKRLQAFWTILREKIEAIRPNVVIALGGEALRAITNEKLISEWRGTLMTYRDIKILPCYHPSYIMRSYASHPIEEIDFAKANKESEYPELRINTPEIIIDPTKERILSWLNDLSTFPRIGYDIETVGKRVRSIAFAKGSRSSIKAITIPFIRFQSSTMVRPDKDRRIIRIGTYSPYAASYWSVNDEIAIIDKISEVFQNKALQKVGQNSIAFDAPLLKDEFGLEIENHFMDTMHAWHVLYSELPMSLNLLCSVLTNYQNYWTKKVTADDISEWNYNAMDAIVTLEASYRIQEELHSSDLWRFYKDHVHPLATALAKSQRVGVLIDKDARDDMLKKQRKLLGDMRHEFDEFVSGEFNPNSHQQVKKLLYDKLHLPTIYKDGKPTTNEEALRNLERKYPNEFVLSKIISYRKVSKMIGTFLDVELDDDGRMRTSYNASGTKTGRISSSKTIWKTGLNLQNIPVGKSRGVENIRHIFVAGTTKCSECKGVGEIKDE